MTISYDLISVESTSLSNSITNMKYHPSFIYMNLLFLKVYRLFYVGRESKSTVKSA
jgi:hypothetical protein